MILNVDLIKVVKYDNSLIKYDTPMSKKYNNKEVENNKIFTSVQELLKIEIVIRINKY